MVVYLYNILNFISTFLSLIAIIFIYEIHQYWAQLRYNFRIAVQYLVCRFATMWDMRQTPKCNGGTETENERGGFPHYHCKWQTLFFSWCQEHYSNIYPYLTLLISVYLTSFSSFKRSTSFPLIFTVSSVPIKRVSTMYCGKGVAHPLRRIKVRKHKTLLKMGSEFPCVGWNMCSVWTDTLSLVRPGTSNERYREKKAFH